jgi:hypothetical protein
MNVEWKEGRTFRCLLTGDLSLARDQIYVYKAGPEETVNAGLSWCVLSLVPFFSMSLD